MRGVIAAVQVEVYISCDKDILGQYTMSIDEAVSLKVKIY